MRGEKRRRAAALRKLRAVGAASGAPAREELFGLFSTRSTFVVRKDLTMRNEKPDAERAWKQLEDVVVPRLCLSVVDRAVDSHLLRHSRLEGEPQLRFSIAWLARGARLSVGPTRRAVRRLVKHGVLRLVKRSNGGHTVEVRLADEIRAALDPGVARGKPARRTGAADARVQETDFREYKETREAIHAREQGFCFCCLRRVEEEAKTLDHVVPRVEGGSNSYRNLVSCCADGNSYKAEKPAADFLRGLYREGRLTAAELTERLRALGALAAGKLRPAVETLAGASADREQAKQPSAGGDQPAKEFTPGPVEEHTEKA
jgi:5-methylcytosine-specific restriction endonuclease McrA